MSAVSIGEAARLVGKSRSVLYATYIKKGKLSVKQNSATGKPEVDIAELVRVFGSFVGHVSTDNIQDGLVHNRTDEKDSKNNAMEAELKGVLMLLRAREEQLDEAKEREAKLWQQVQELIATVRLIEDKSQSADEKKRKRKWLFF